MDKEKGPIILSTNGTAIVSLLGILILISHSIYQKKVMEKVQQAIAFLERRLSNRCIALLVSQLLASFRVLNYKDGNILNVIDTPGLFDFSSGPDFVVKELVKCLDLAKDGFHAVLLVLSVRTRFSREEHASVQSLLNLFESKISDYMIVVFTGGDELEDDETLDDYLGCFPEPLKEALKQCGNRRVLFNNKTRDLLKKDDQLRNLLLHVNLVVEKNGGKPYTTYLFKDLKVESNLREMRHLEAELAKECVAHLEAEKSAEAALMNLENKRRLMRDIYRQRPMVADKLQERKLGSLAGMCRIL